MVQPDQAQSVQDRDFCFSVNTNAKIQNKSQIKNSNHKFSYLYFIIILCFVFCTLSLALAASERKPRYISLAPSTTEILFALDLDEEIVGISNYCNYPDKTKAKEKMGDFSSPNIEKVLSLKPDYIFSTGLEQALVVSKLKELGLKVYMADPSNIKELLDTIREIGAITARKNEAKKLIQDIEARIKKVSSQVELVPQEKRPKVFVEIWHDPLTTIGRGSFVDDLITLAGGVNIAYDTKRAYSIFSQEEVVKRNPDYIIIAYMDKESPLKIVQRRFGWHTISAVKNKRVYNDINPDLILRPGPRAVEGLKAIFRKLRYENKN